MRDFNRLPVTALVASALCVASVLVLAQPPDLAQLDLAIEQARTNWNVPGLAVAIVKDGKPVLAKGYGVRELGKPEAVDADTLFGIASNTKAFTATAISMLADDQKLTLDDRVVTHLPYFQLYDPYVTSDIRIRDLLCHRSGLGTFSGDLLWYGTSYSREEVIRRARFLKQASPFRAQYGYQNLMFVAAGEIVSAVSGKSWDAFVKERIFDPLGMTRTITTFADITKATNIATPHAGTFSPLRTYPWRSWDGCAPAAGIVSSAHDMAKWIALHLDGGKVAGKQLLSRTAQRTLWTPHLSFMTEPNPAASSAGLATSMRLPVHFRGYGLGFAVSDVRGRFVAQHEGTCDGMFSCVVLVPEEKLGFVILSNSDTSLRTALSYVILDAYLGGDGRDWFRLFLERAKQTASTKQLERDRIEKARLKGTQPSLPLSKYAGSFVSALYGEAKVELENNNLVLRLLPNPDMVADLAHWHLDTFSLTWRRPFPWFGNGRAQFVLNPDARVTELKLDVPNEDFWFYELDLKREK
jgi:CubicO group peptidase (beta-lactamase class C family)